MSYKSMSILTDVTKCIGCEACVDACQSANHLPRERRWRWIKNITDLSTARWTTIETASTKDGERRFIRRQCRHCLQPACVEACIVGAMKKPPEGPVIYDPEICIGCRYCMIACPWEIPRYSWEEAVPYVQKCTFCYSRVIHQGKIPACIEACPTQATIFGEREELLKEAHMRLKEDPTRYIQHIWGEHEVGGTSVLYISDVPLNLTDLDHPVVDTTPMPDRTFKVLRHMPSVFVGMALAMGGLHWVINRRQKLMHAEHAEESSETTDDA